jgi:hypothetical protein
MLAKELTIVLDVEKQCQVNFDSISPLAVQVDHCHTSSYIRGILCGGCNSGLAYFREDATTLTGAIAYLGGVLRT